MLARKYAMIGGSGIVAEAVTLLLDRVLLDQPITLAPSDKPEKHPLNVPAISPHHSTP